MIIGFIIIAFQGLNLGVDFRGGRSYVISFTKPVIATDMKVAISESFKNSSTEVKLYGSDDVMQVTTSYLMDDESDGADEKVRVALVDAIEKFQWAQTFS